MISLSPFPERLRTVFEPTSRGVVGLVDDLLLLCREHSLQFNFHDNHCVIRTLEGDTQEGIEIPLAKPVFRAVLARVAALCSKRTPNSVTPYHGECELTIDADPPSVCHVSFTNTPAKQRLELRYAGEFGGQPRKFTVLLHDKRVVAVHGHSLKYVPNDSNPNDLGSYGILCRIEGTEILVALFRVMEVIGIFSGEMPESRECTLISLPKAPA